MLYFPKCWRVSPGTSGPKKKSSNFTRLKKKIQIYTPQNLNFQIQISNFQIFKFQIQIFKFKIQKNSIKSSQIL